MHAQRVIREVRADQAYVLQQLSQQLLQQWLVLHCRVKRLPRVCQQQWIVPERLLQFTAMVRGQLIRLFLQLMRGAQPLHEDADPA